MGASSSKDAKKTNKIKSSKFSENFSIQITSGKQKLNLEGLIGLHQGMLKLQEFEIPITKPKGFLQLVEIDPTSQHLFLRFSNNEVWRLHHESLNALLEFRKKIQISMRPRIIQTPHQCLSCSKAGEKNCFYCGNKCCKSHLALRTDLDLLGYSRPCLICDRCLNDLFEAKSILSKQPENPFPLFSN
jgi:hypothetical protein